MASLVLLLPVAGLIALIMFVTRDRDHSRQRTMLRRKYMKLSPLNPSEAEQEMRSGLQNIKNANPERSGSWHLRKLIAQMRRDSR
jgi:hypothetical protein